MCQILAPLIRAGRSGVQMRCTDGWTRHVHPILTAYITDFPEQCLICCNKQNHCPTCLVAPNNLEFLVGSCYPEPENIKCILANSPENMSFSESSLHHVPEPFWAELPYTNIFACITPDLLHQLHKGMFKDHLVSWFCTKHKVKVDAGFRCVPTYSGLCIFCKGISSILQWMGNKYWQMEKVFVGIVAWLDGIDCCVVTCTSLISYIWLTIYCT